MMMTLALVDRGVTVHAEDVNPERVAFAAELGGAGAATDVDQRFPLVVDTVGSPSSMAVSLDRIAVGGLLLCLGLDNRTIELTLRGSLTYDHPTDFEATTALIAAGRFAAGRVITDEYPLEAAQLAFEGNRSARGKTWIRVTGDA
jgi:alcohol dehydrogenase/L-iditol 2-dehydrogenase